MIEELPYLIQYCNWYSLKLCVIENKNSATTQVLSHNKKSRDGSEKKGISGSDGHPLRWDSNKMG